MENVGFLDRLVSSNERFSSRLFIYQRDLLIVPARQLISIFTGILRSRQNVHVEFPFRIAGNNESREQLNNTRVGSFTRSTSRKWKRTTRSLSTPGEDEQSLASIFVAACRQVSFNVRDLKYSQKMNSANSKQFFRQLN